MDSYKLYLTWFVPLAHLSPDGCHSRLRNLTWLIVGLYRANALCRAHSRADAALPRGTG